MTVLLALAARLRASCLWQHPVDHGSLDRDWKPAVLPCAEQAAAMYKSYPGAGLDTRRCAVCQVADELEQEAGRLRPGLDEAVLVLQRQPIHHGLDCEWRDGQARAVGFKCVCQVEMERDRR